MGDDVLAVIDALKLDRPLVAGHSLGGEELSSIGTRHPEKVSGLIYLDAAYAYAFYDPKTVKQHGQTDPPRPAQLKLRDRIVDSIVSGERRYAAVKTPVLAIVASPRACTDNCDTPQYKAAEVDRAAQAAAFQTATPQARVVRIPKSEHYVFMSNEAEVVREMNAFMDGLH
jgi:pimeloyl-ACP methyl ester carboxylesterase